MYKYSQSLDEELLHLHKRVQQGIADIHALPEGTELISLEVELENKLELLVVLEKELESRNLMIKLK